MTLTKSIVWLLSVCLTITLSLQTSAQNNVQATEELSLTIEEYAQPMAFNVTLPSGYKEDTDKQYFVLFDLHPRSHKFITGMHDWLSHNGEWPWLETIVVTPKDYHKEFAESFERLAADSTDRQMLDIIGNQLLPTLDKRYRTNGFRIYTGFMSNAAVGLHILLNSPDMFNAYLLSSPTLNDNFFDIEASAKRRLEPGFQRSTFLHLSIGKHGYEKAHIKGVNHIAKLLEDIQPTNLDWHVENAQPNYYMSRPVITLLNGIERLFDDIHHDLAADSTISQQGAQAIIQYYEQLSNNKYGFPISAEGSLKNLADSEYEERPESGLSLYETITKRYPDSAYAFSSLAAAHFAMGSRESAVNYQRIAVEKSLIMVEWHQRHHQKLLEQYLSASVK